MFIGREYYLERLEALWRKSVASFKCGFIEIEGLAPDKYMTNEKQIENFCASLARTTGSPEVRADRWPKAVSESDQEECKTLIVDKCSNHIQDLCSLMVNFDIAE